jgi:diguanylate cyclase (GGDEF)-like protein
MSPIEHTKKSLINIMNNDNSVLVVHNNSSLIDEMNEILCKSKFNVISATSSIEALSKISFQLPNIIISDYNLEHENGIDFCVKIRSSIKTKLIPFIIISETEHTGENIRAIKNGADFFLVRPYNKEELLAHIENKISHYNDFYQLSIRDELTNLYNRREFMSQFTSFTTQHPDEVVSVAMVDLDYFKQVNDIHGHQTGDLVLMKLADIFQKHINESFIPTRFGGEEFAILMPTLEAESAFELIEDIRNEFLSIVFYGAKNKTFHVSFSCGISTYPDFALNISDVLSLSDQALYSAKKDGRSRTYIYKKFMSYNDRFWEYFEKSNHLFIDINNNDIVTNLPFLPKLLEFITTDIDEINSIGILNIHVEPVKGVRNFYDPHVYDIIIQNIKKTVQQVCISKYASDTYYSVSSIFEYSYTILFPSLFDFTLNKEKCHQLYNEIVETTYDFLIDYPVNISYSDGVIYYDSKNKKAIKNTISLMVRDKVVLPSKNKIFNILNIYEVFNNYYKSYSVFETSSGKTSFSYISHKLTGEFIPEFSFLLSSSNCNLEDLHQILNYYIQTSKESTLFFPYIESIPFDVYFEAIKSHSENNSFCILFDENYISKNIDLFKNLNSKNDSIQLGISNSYIHSEVLKILSLCEFKILMFTKYLFYDLHTYRSRIKLISGLTDFTDQLDVKSCVCDIKREEDIQYIKALQIDYYSTLF